MTKIHKLSDKIGPSTESKKPQKPIEFVKNLAQVTGKLQVVDYEPWQFENLMLISSGEKFDVIGGWDAMSSDGYVHIYLGHWNDGVV